MLYLPLSEVVDGQATRIEGLPESHKICLLLPKGMDGQGSEEFLFLYSYIPQAGTRKSALRGGLVIASAGFEA